MLRAWLFGGSVAQLPFDGLQPLPVVQWSIHWLGDPAGYAEQSAHNEAVKPMRKLLLAAIVFAPLYAHVAVGIPKPALK
jgi:hypothetical protein